MEEILAFIDDLSKRLSRPIRDLEDVRQAMSALADVREHQIHMDMSLGPIEVITFLYADVKCICLLLSN